VTDPSSGTPGTGTSDVRSRVVPVRALHRTIARRGESLVVVVAHPDDETFGCGSLIAAAAEAGAVVTVICATAGELGESTMPVTRHELGRIRSRELHAAAAVLGVARVVRLGYGDSGFDGPVPAGSLCAATITDVADRLVGELDAVRPDVVVMLDGSDGHRDHRAIHGAASLAIDQWSTCTGHPTRVYEHVLLRSLMQEWLSTRRSDADGDPYAAVADIGRPDEDVTDVVETGHVLDRREQAIAMHASQMSPFAGIDPDLCRRFLTADHLVRLR
jgi:N-acetyl-1-D-myo-inositol-2-amino-2-deoxy-alpha-D-glucopyranoside deacetylase